MKGSMVISNAGQSYPIDRQVGVAIHALDVTQYTNHDAHCNAEASGP